MRSSARSTLALLGRFELRLWGLMTDLRMRRQGGRFRLQLPAGRVRFGNLPHVRVHSGRRGGTTTMTVGAETSLGRDLMLDLDTGANTSLSIGEGCEFERGVRLQLLGGRIELGADTEVRDNVTLKVSSAESALVLGDHIRLGRAASIQCHERVVVDDHAAIGERAMVVDSFHDVDGSDTWTMDQPVRSAPIHIERNALVMTGATVLHGAVVGRNAVIAAGALVPEGVYPPGWVFFGSPAKPVRRLPLAPESGDVQRPSRASA